VSIPAFGVRKPVPANLLMVALILGGIVCGLALRREFFPEVDPDSATVSLVYPGASPKEIEETLAIKVEDKLADLDEVDELYTTLAEGGGGITVEFRDSVNDIPRAIDELERAIDSLTDLPEESEDTQVREFEVVIPVIRVAIYGDIDELILKQAITQISDDLKTLPGMGDVKIGGVRDYEIQVDVNQHELLKHGVSLPQVADVIGAWMAEVPGGTVRSETGNIKVRTFGVVERAEAIRQIVVKATPDGQSIRVGDIATVRDSFVDEDLITRFDGQPSASITVLKLGQQDIVKMAEMVRYYVQARNGTPYAPSMFERIFASHRLTAYELGATESDSLPRGTRLATSSDYARFVEGRLDLLSRNALQGGVLVFLTLLFFLNWRAAMWVGIGLMTAICGTLILMYLTDVTLNLLTMFGMIMVIGLLVDDGIVVSENIQKRHDIGEPALVAATKGGEEVFWPVVATVMTSIVAFMPLKFIDGQIGDLMGALPSVVACALFMSLVESLLILPSHMGHTLAKRDRLKSKGESGLLMRFEGWRDNLIFNRAVPTYSAFLEKCLKYRYVSLCVAIMMLMISIGLVVGGRAKYTFLTESDAETIIVDIRMPIGTTVQKTNEIVSVIENAARQQPEVTRMESTIGQRFNVDTGSADAFASHIAQIFVELKATEERNRESGQIITAIRRSLQGKLADVDRLNFTEMSGGPTGPDITIQVRGNDLKQMDELVGEIKSTLANYDGVFDIADDNELGQREMRITLKPGAAAIGFSTAEVARQVRGSLYGIDAHVFADLREDIDVRVRLDEQTRRNVHEMEQLWLISPTGKPVPLTEIAEIKEGLTYSTIKRVDRRRNITITADVAQEIQPEQIIAKLPLEKMAERYPALEIHLGGKQEQEREAFESLPYGFAAALVMVYVILAWLFSSYTQPLAVMVAIPFSLVGVIWGHMVLDYEITFLSIIGFIALSGVVVNDSLIFVEFLNRELDKGTELKRALVAAGRARLRPIVLTSLTTVLGLLPLMLERSFQAKFIVPMAIAISGGLISATFLILLILPCVLVIIDDFKAMWYFCWNGMPRPAKEEELPATTTKSVQAEA